MRTATDRFDPKDPTSTSFLRVGQNRAPNYTELEGWDLELRPESNATAAMSGGALAMEANCPNSGVSAVIGLFTLEVEQRQ